MLIEGIGREGAVAVAARPLELAVVIPTFNEAANVGPLLDKLVVALAGVSWEAVFVDDNSPDGTSDLVRTIARANPRVRIVQRVGRRGLSTAVVEGMLATAAPILAVIDGDMQHDERILPKLYQAVASGRYDVAVGTRYGEGGGVGDWSAERQRISGLATTLGQRLLGVSLSDPMSGFFVVSRETLMRALPRLSGVGFKVLIDMLSSVGQPLRVAEVPYQFRARTAGESKLDALVGLEYLALLADKTVGRYVPLRLVSFCAVGGFGVLVHMAALAVTLGLGAAFVAAQTAAVLVAMTCNFFLNNIFTYRDRRLEGWGLVRGLLSFYAVCMIGGVANIGIGTWVNGHHVGWWLAGLAGVVIGAVWNFAASSVVTWRKS